MTRQMKWEGARAHPKTIGVSKGQSGTHTGGIESRREGWRDGHNMTELRLIARGDPEAWCLKIIPQ